MYWDKFITDLKALCEKHHVMFKGNKDGEIPEHVLALAADLKHEVEDEIGDCLPWMDNCDYNHSFSYDLTRRPAGIIEEICSVNYDAKSYKDVLKFEAMYADNDEDEGEDD